MTFTIINCRSLKFKLRSLATNFVENKNSFILTNETWFKQRDPQLKQYLHEIEEEFDIKCIRKDRKLGRTGLAHGGVALFFDAAICSFKKMDLNALKGAAKDYEILACKGNLKGVKRQVVVFSCYLPPGIPSKQVSDILETLTDAVSEAKAKADSPWRGLQQVRHVLH